MYTNWAKHWVGGKVEKEKKKMSNEKSIATRRLFKDAANLRSNSTQFNGMLQFAKQCCKTPRRTSLSVLKLVRQFKGCQV